MEFFVDFTEVFVSHVGVDLSGADAAMAEHGLDAADVSTIHE